MNTPTNDDSGLRRLLDDAVSDVHPRGTSEQMRARVKRPATSRWLPLTLAAAVATVLVISGASWLAQRDPGAPAASQDGTPGPGAAQTVRVPAYYLGQTAAGQRLFKETHEVTGTTDSLLQSAVDETLTGRPLDPDYTAFPVPGITATATADGARITIDLTVPANAGEPAPGVDAGRSLQALVRAAQDATRSELPVLVSVNGATGGSFLGVDLAEPLRPVSADQTLAPVSVNLPAEGATVGTRFEVTGQAATFEANVVWELKQGDEVVRQGVTTAQECCTLSPYSFTVTAQPGDYTLVVHDTDDSDGEGVGVSQDTKNITVE